MVCNMNHEVFRRRDVGELTESRLLLLLYMYNIYFVTPYMESDLVTGKQLKNFR